MEKGQARLIALAYVASEAAGSAVDWEVAFLALLEDEHGWVRLWTACHAVQFDPERAVPVLELLARESGPLGLDAQMTLRTVCEKAR